MDMFAEFLFDSERVVPSTSSFQSSHQQQGTDDESNNDDDDRTATNTTASTSASSSHDNDNDNSEMPSSEDSDYGHHVEVMVSGMLELQRQQQQQQQQQDEDDATSYFSGSTIVSSAPSVPTIGADPYLGQNRLARRVQSSAALSLSTASSQFLDLDNDHHHAEEENQEAEASVASSSSSVAAREPSSSSSSIDFTSSVIDSSISFRSSWSRPIMQGFRLGDAMEITDTAGISSDPRRRAGSSQTFTTAVQAASHQLVLPTGRGMILRDNSNNTSSFQNGMWYAHFTDADWDAFRQRAQMVVKSLFTTSMPQRPLRDTYQLPPRPPALLLCHAVSDPSTEQEEEAKDCRSNADKATDCGLPICFLCPLCEDVIVGAITLDCGCQRNVCAACWEYHCVAQKGLRRRALQQLALECDYVIVPSNADEQQEQEQTAVCPNCFREVHEPLGCHALDVAIAQLMLQQQHQQQHGQHFRTVWESYVQRVEHWREELVRRQVENEPSPLETLHQEQHVARLIEEEETYWKRQQQQRQRAAAACGGGFLGMAVAVMASMGMKLLMAQTVRAIQNGRP